MTAPDETESATHAGDATDASATPWQPSRAAVALAAVVSALLVLVVARFTRPGIGPDATAYVAVADSIKAGNGFGFWLEDPLVTWPPLWPMLIAATSAVTRLRTDIAGLIVNTAAAAGCVVAGWAVAERGLKVRFTRTAMLVSLAVSPLMVGLAVLVQTEVVFALIALCTIVVLLRWAEDQRPHWLVIGGLLCATGFFIRYQALYAVPALAAWVLLRDLIERRGPVRAVADAAWFAVPAVAPAALWVARNLTVSDTALGPRFPSNIGPIQNVIGALSTTVKFLLSVPTLPKLPAAVLMFVAFVVGGWALVRTTTPSAATSTDASQRLTDRATSALVGPMGLLATFVGGFTALMIVSRSMVGFDDLDIRLLAPCLIPTSILFLRWCELVLFSASGWRTAAGRAAVGVWLGIQVLVVAVLVGPGNSIIGDYGFNSDRAVAASQSPALDALPDGCVPHTNNAVDLYRSGFEAQLSPRHREYKSSQPTDDLAELRTAIERGERACLVWLDYNEDDEVFSVDELSEHFVLTKLATADGVTTYTITLDR